jgi:hypothetical protein
MTNTVGLVVEPVVLNRLGIFPESARAVLADWQRRLADLLEDQPLPETGEWASVAPSCQAFAMELLDGQAEDPLVASALAQPIAVRLDDYDETLAPTWVVNGSRRGSPAAGAGAAGRHHHLQPLPRFRRNRSSDRRIASPSWRD